MKKWIVLALLSVTLAACGGSGGEPNPPTKVAKVVEEKEFKPIPYKETKADGVCSANGGFKSCYGLAFECSDGAKIKPEKAHCMDGNFVDDGVDNKSNGNNAQTAKAETTPRSPHERCKDYSEIAEIIMNLRLSGVPMSEAMEIAGDSNLLQSLTKEAYDSPNFTTEEYQRRAKTEFSNKVYATCRKEIG